MANIPGIVMALLALTMWGISAFLTAVLGRRANNIKSTFLYYLFSFAIFAFLCLITGIKPVSVFSMILAIATSLIYVLGTLSYFKALSIGRVSVVASITPLYAIIPFLAGLFLFGESVSMISVAGALLAIVSSSLMNFKPSEFKGIKGEQIKLPFFVVLSWGIYTAILNCALKYMSVYSFYAFSFLVALFPYMSIPRWVAYQ